jgi:hypothetical protein
VSWFFLDDVTVNDQRFGDDVLHAEARVEGGEGVLKNDLQVAAQAAHFASTGGEQVAAVQAHAARCGLDQT